MLKKLLSILLYYQHNMKILHWKSMGCHFAGIHELCNDYYEKLADYSDLVAEMGLSNDENPVDLLEAFEILKSDSYDYKILKGSEDFNNVQVYANIGIMFDDLMREIDSLLKNKEIQDNTAFRTSLEEMYTYLNIEYNYKCKRALSEK